MTSPIELRVGMLVDHPKRPEWGPGKVVKVVTERIYVVFRDLPDREAKKLIGSVLQVAESQHDDVLDNLPPLVEKDGNMILPATRVPFQHAVDKFNTMFPQGFYDPAYLGNLTEGARVYKLAAHEYFVEHLGGNKFRELLESDLHQLVREIERCIGKVNLLFSTESAALHDALKADDSARLLMTRLADLLEAKEINEGVYQPYADAVCRLPAERGRVASWPVATVLPFLAQPDRHILLKPEITKQVADSLGFELNYRPEPNWRTYRSLLQMAEIYKQKLAPLKPRDLIDVQSFFWVACGGYDK